MSYPPQPGPYPSYPYPGYPPAPYPPPRPSHPHPEPREYHQVLRTWSYRWWKPFVGLVLFVPGVFFAVTVVTVGIAALATSWEDRSFTDILGSVAGEEGSSFGPTELLILNLGLAALIPVTWVLIRVLHQMRPRWLSSVVPKLRWNFLLLCLALSVVALVAQIVVSVFLPEAAGNEGIEGSVNDFTRTAAWLTLIVLLTTPFQAAAEEYVFRGYLLQAIGSFVARPWWKWVAITITALLFATAHGTQNFPLFFDRFCFGFIVGWLTIRTGGLEAGIAMHVLNNYLAFGFSIFFGDFEASLTITEVPWTNIIATLTQSGVYVVLVLWTARRLGLQRRSQPPGSLAPDLVGDRPDG